MKSIKADKSISNFWYEKWVYIKVCRCKKKEATTKIVANDESISKFCKFIQKVDNYKIVAKRWVDIKVLQVHPKSRQLQKLLQKDESMSNFVSASKK